MRLHENNYNISPFLQIDNSLNFLTRFIQSIQTALKFENATTYTNVITAMENFIVSKKINYVYMTSSQSRFVLPNLSIAVNLSKYEKALCFLYVRCSSHWGGSPQNVLGDGRTCGTTLASAYVLRHLSTAWSQLQMKERSLSGSECWVVCRRWTPEIEFNKRLSLSIIRLANYNVTTSLIYKVVV